MENLVGLKIKSIRKEKKLTQKDLSSGILDRTTLSKIENGIKSPSINQLNHISKVLNVPISTLLCEKEVTCKTMSSLNTYKDLHSLFDQKEYYKIIDNTIPYDFITTYFVGVSYYKLDFKNESEKFLSRCEKLFSLLSEELKPLYVEYLAIAITTLRKLKLTSFSSTDNLKALKKALAYLEMYNMKNCKTYFATVNNIGVYYLYKDDYNLAINWFESFLSNSFEILTINVLPYIHLNLNISYFSLKQYDKAIFHIKKAIFFYDYIGDSFQSKECYENLFKALLYDNKIDEARTLINELLNKFNNYNINNLLKCCELELLYNTKNIDLILSKSKFIAVKHLNEPNKMNFYYILAYAYFKKDNSKLALKYYNLCITYLIENKRYLDTYLAYEHMYILTQNAELKAKATKFKSLHSAQIYNHICSNITSPCLYQTSTVNRYH